jgi:hypothetical protein
MPSIHCPFFDGFFVPPRFGDFFGPGLGLSIANAVGGISQNVTPFGHSALPFLAQARLEAS